MSISASDVKTLRERTGAGIMDAKGALQEADGDFERAAEILRVKGQASAAKRGGRVASQGVVASYIHPPGTIGVLVEVDCETDFVARTEEFQTLAREIAMQIAAMNPLVVNENEELPATADLRGDEVVLLKQIYIRDGSKTVQDLINETIGKTGENIHIRRFMRFELGA
jgi:elongation factor Ts